MTTQRFDYSPLAAGASVRARLRGVGRDLRLVMGATIGLVLVAVPAIALVAMALTGQRDRGVRAGQLC